jgi:hypothetical protein
VCSCASPGLLPKAGRAGHWLARKPVCPCQLLTMQPAHATHVLCVACRRVTPDSARSDSASPRSAAASPRCAGSPCADGGSGRVAQPLLVTPVAGEPPAREKWNGWLSGCCSALVRWRSSAAWLLLSLSTAKPATSASCALARRCSQHTHQRRTAGRSSLEGNPQRYPGSPALGGHSGSYYPASPAPGVSLPVHPTCSVLHSQPHMHHLGSGTRHWHRQAR